MFWDIRAIQDMPCIDDSRSFSIFARGLWLQYYYHLASADKENSSADDILAKFHKWLAYSRKKLKGWDITAFLQGLRNAGSGGKPVIGETHLKKTEKFLQDSYEQAIRSKDPADVVMKNSRKTIVDQESEIKANRAKLSNKDAFNEWDKDIRGISNDLYHYDYTWGRPSKNIINDIVKGLNDV